MADTFFLHLVGTAIAKEPGNSRQESAVDKWLPAQAPGTAVSLGKIQLDAETEVFHKVVDVDLHGPFGIRVHLGADVYFKGTIEIFKPSA